MRLALAPVVALLAFVAPYPSLFAVCLTVAFLSDVFDGILARRLGVATPNLRRFDSAADTAFYAACLLAAWHLYPAAIVERWMALCVLVTLELIRYVYDFAKFRREASYHMWSSKLWGLCLFAGFVSLLVFGIHGVAVSLAIYLGIIANSEGLAISVILPRWQSDIPSIVHALQARGKVGVSPS